MGAKIEIPQGNNALTEFVQFYDQVYDYREARWPAPLELQLPSPATVRSLKVARYVRFSLMREVISSRAPLR
jgi:hypothetical protein